MSNGVSLKAVTLWLHGGLITVLFMRTELIVSSEQCIDYSASEEKPSVQAHLNAEQQTSDLRDQLTRAPQKKKVAGKQN